MRSLHSSSATLADTGGDMQAKSKEGHVDEAGRSLQHYGYEPQDTPWVPAIATESSPPPVPEGTEDMSEICFRGWAMSHTRYVRIAFDVCVRITLAYVR